MLILKATTGIARIGLFATFSHLSSTSLLLRLLHTDGNITSVVVSDPPQPVHDIENLRELVALAAFGEPVDWPLGLSYDLACHLISQADVTSPSF